jgi:hypothetical protein
MEGRVIPLDEGITLYSASAGKDMGHAKFARRGGLICESYEGGECLTALGKTWPYV